VLTNFIQADGGLSGSSNKSALPFPSAAPGASRFASTLQSARAPTLVAPQPEAAAVAGPGKPAEKKTAENSKTTAPDSASVVDAKPPSVIVVDLATMPPQPHGITGSIAAADSTPSLISSRSDGTAASITRAEPANKDASPGLSHEFQQGTLAGKSETPPSSVNVSRDEPSTAALKGAVAASVAVLKSTGTPASASSLLDAPTPGLSPSLAEFAGTGSNPRPVLATPTQNGIPPHAVDAVSGAAHAAGVNQSATDSKQQAGNSDLQPGHITPPIQSALPLAAMDPTANPTNAVIGLKQSCPDGKLQASNVDARPAVTNPSALPLDATDPTSAVAMFTAVDQSASDRKAPSGGASGPGSLAALASSFTVSSMASAAEIAKQISLPSAMLTKARETNSTAEARARETSSDRVASNQPPANQAPSNQPLSGQSLANQEGMRSKPTDSFANRGDANAQPPSTSGLPAPASGSASGGNPAGVIPADVLLQVSPAANQDFGSQHAASPGAELQPLAASPPSAAPTAGPVETARLVAGVAQSEMHIGLRTQAFGSVEVHTVVRDSQVGLSVGSERGDLRSFLATEVSGLQTTFRQQDLRFESIRFLETSAGTTAGFSGGADSQPRSSSQPQASPSGLFSIHGPHEEAPELVINAGLRTRLNVHA